MMDQHQPIEIARFRVQKTGDNWKIGRIGNYFRHRRRSETKEIGM
jgi:hypothetical protein